MDGVTRNVLNADNRAPVPVGLVRRPFGVGVVHLSTHETHVAAAIAYVNVLTLHGEFKIPVDVHGNFRVSAKSLLVKEELDEKFLRDFGLAVLSLPDLAPEPVPPHRMGSGPGDSGAQSLSENRLLSCGERRSATPSPIPDVKVCFRHVLSAPDLPDSPILGRGPLGGSGNPRYNVLLASLGCALEVHVDHGGVADGIRLALIHPLQRCLRWW